MGLLALLAATPQAVASNLTYGQQQPSPTQLQIQRNIERRETFQLEQQRLREQDRRINSATQPVPDVRSFKGTCQNQVFGSNSMRACR